MAASIERAGVLCEGSMHQVRDFLDRNGMLLHPPPPILPPPAQDRVGLVLRDQVGSDEAIQSAQEQSRLAVVGIGVGAGENARICPVAIGGLIRSSAGQECRRHCLKGVAIGHLRQSQPTPSTNAGQATEPSFGLPGNQRQE